jgi:uncharacterized protein
MAVVTVVTIVAVRERPHRDSAPSTKSFTSKQVSLVTDEQQGLQTSGTLTTPTAPGPHPAELFIAGSGPTDRNGDTLALPGTIGTMKFLAESVAVDAVTFRFDKLGVGASSIPTDPSSVTLDDFVNEASAALTWLKSQPGVDPSRISVAGHSEGGLIALKLAATPKMMIQNLALFSPPGARYLSVIREQLAAQVQGDVLTTYDDFVQELRQTGTIAKLPTDQILPSILNAATVNFLANADRFDPVEMASTLPAATKVLLSCGEKDIQVSCDSLAALRTRLYAAQGENFIDVRLLDTNHVLRVARNGAGGPETYIDPSLPYAVEAAAALGTLVSKG